MSVQKLKTSVADGICTITLDDPPANTYSYEMMQGVDAAVLAARMDASVHLIVEQTPKLVIAAFNGHTVGGGLEKRKPNFSGR